MEEALTYVVSRLLLHPVITETGAQTYRNYDIEEDELQPVNP